MKLIELLTYNVFESTNFTKPINQVQCYRQTQLARVGLLIIIKLSLENISSPKKSVIWRKIAVMKIDNAKVKKKTTKNEKNNILEWSRDRA